MAELINVAYLGATAFPGKFPADGRIVGSNHRLMINLACCRQSHDPTPATYIVFLVGTGSPVSYLYKKPMELLIGNTENIPQSLFVLIQR